jgi:hypothetical protein
MGKADPNLSAWTVVTRNGVDFERTGVPLLDPWSAR